MVSLCAQELHYNLFLMFAKRNKKQIAICITLIVVRTLYNLANNSAFSRA